jgi:hypothetical protein
MKPLFVVSYHVIPVSGRDALSIVFMVIIVVATWVWLKDLMDNN